MPRGAESVVKERKSSAVYGEIMPAATGHLLDYLQLGTKDVLVDFGSGVGKLIVQAALTHKLRRCVGYELVKPRHQTAQDALQDAIDQRLLKTRDVEFRNADFMRGALEPATVIYTCSTAFPEALMQRLVRRVSKLPSGTRFVSLQDIDDNPWFDLKDVLRLDMSWARRRKVHIYVRR